MLRNFSFTFFRDRACKKEIFIYWDVSKQTDWFNPFWTCVLEDDSWALYQDIIREVYRDFSFKFKLPDLTESLTKLYDTLAQYDGTPDKRTHSYDSYYLDHDFLDFFKEWTPSSIFCNNSDNYEFPPPILEPNDICDGILHCPDAEDESLEKCSHIFAPSANIVCNKSNTNPNYEFLIKATPCDGNQECRDNEDESNCEEKNQVIYLTLGIAALLFLAISMGFVIHTFVLKLIDNATDSTDADELAMAVANIQRSKRKDISTVEYFQNALQSCDMNVPETLINLKVTLFR